MLFTIEVTRFGLAIKDEDGKILILVDPEEFVKKVEQTRLAFNKTQLAQKDYIFRILLGQQIF